MNSRWMDGVLALVVAAVMAAMVLWPDGPRPEDLHLEIVSVSALPAAQGRPQQVEVRVRWHWLRRPASTPSWDVLAVGSDPGRWIVTAPSSGVGANDRLLSLVGQPAAHRGNRVIPGQDEEYIFVLTGRGAGQFYEAQAMVVSREVV
jgi:hypothetical protein